MQECMCFTHAEGFNFTVEKLSGVLHCLLGVKNQAVRSVTSREEKRIFKNKPKTHMPFHLYFFKSVFIICLSVYLYLSIHPKSCVFK